MLYNSEQIKKILSKNIRSERLSAGLTHDKLSEKADISTAFLKDIEGNVSSCSLVTLVNLCLALNTNPNQILRDIFAERTFADNKLINQINLLSDYERNAVFSLVQYFINNHLA